MVQNASRKCLALRRHIGLLRHKCQASRGIVPRGRVKVNAHENIRIDILCNDGALFQIGRERGSQRLIV